MQSILNIPNPVQHSVIHTLQTSKNDQEYVDANKELKSFISNLINEPDSLINSIRHLATLNIDKNDQVVYLNTMQVHCAIIAYFIAKGVWPRNLDLLDKFLQKISLGLPHVPRDSVEILNSFSHPETVTLQANPLNVDYIYICDDVKNAHKKIYIMYLF